MSRLWRAAVVGAVIAVVSWTVSAGPPPLELALDPIIWLVYVFVALTGAFATLSVVLAWRQVRQSPRWLFATLGGLLLLSVPVVWPFVQETRDTQRFLATAETTTGVVANKYVRGGIHLIVEYEAVGRMQTVHLVGQNPFVGTPAYSAWARGDSIPVYYQPTAPEIARVGHPGPEWRALMESLVKVWIVCGVLLTAYLPLVGHRLRHRFTVTAPPLRQPQT